MSGLELLRRLRSAGNDVPVILLADESDVPTAVAAIREARPTSSRSLRGRGRAQAGAETAARSAAVRARLNRAAGALILQQPLQQRDAALEPAPLLDQLEDQRGAFEIDVEVAQQTRDRRRARRRSPGRASSGPAPRGSSTPASTRLATQRARPGATRRDRLPGSRRTRRGHAFEDQFEAGHRGVLMVRCRRVDRTALRASSARRAASRAVSRAAARS